MLKIGHLYPDLLDLYGDRGNILTLEARAGWRGIETKVEAISIGAPLDFADLDILFLGGGSDREQSLLVDDLKRRKADLSQAIDDGLVVLTICGGYQLLGDYYQLQSGEKIPGLGLLNLWTIAGAKRMIGNVAVKLYPLTDAEGEGSRERTTLVGFENHGGKTYLGPELHPLGQVLAGHGNNGEDGMEGVRCQNVIGTYLHGPLLPKNPHLADFLLKTALERKGRTAPLEPLDDKIENLAHQVMLERLVRS